VSLEDLIRQGRLERVDADSEAASAAREEANRHLESAERIYGVSHFEAKQVGDAIQTAREIVERARA
jgi:hypothetical protein